MFHLEFGLLFEIATVICMTFITQNFESSAKTQVFFMIFSVSACLCVFALDDLQKFSPSTSGFMLHCLSGRCYWHPESKGMVELVRNNVHKVPLPIFELKLER